MCYDSRHNLLVCDTHDSNTCDNHMANHKSTVITPLTKEPVKLLWEVYEQEQIDITVNDEGRRIAQKAFIGGFAACRGIMVNFICQLSEKEAVAFCTSIKNEIDAYIAEYRRRDGKLGDKLNGE